MKFSHTLSLNANPDWTKFYLDYAGLKKYINEVSAGNKTEDDFLAKIRNQIQRCQAFYQEKRTEMDQELGTLKFKLVRTASSSNLEDLANLPEAMETSPLIEDKRLPLKPVHQIPKEQLEEARREICELFSKYHSLKQFLQLNRTAIKKILKKFDKSIMTHYQETHLEDLQALLPQAEEERIEKAMDFLTDYFAHFFCKGNKAEARKKMEVLLREYVTFQRQSVWLDVIQDRRKNEAATATATTAKDAEVLSTRSYVIHQVKTSSTIQLGLFSLSVFILLLVWPGIFDDDPVKRNALAMFIFVSLLWAAEVLPLFVTAMLVPFLTVTMRILIVDGVRLGAKDASKMAFDAMFSHVIMLLLGGFSIAAALTKHNIAKVMASAISRKFGDGIRTTLLVNQMIATVSSMWISNVAAPVLCYSLVSPILKAATAEKSRAMFGTSQMENADYDHRLCRALVMGIALASNVGGMASPISSPQNLFAIEYTPIGWIAWFTVSIPICILLNLIIWAWLIFCYQLPSGHSAAVAWALQRESHAGSTEEPFTTQQYFVMVVSVGVVLLWCGSVQLAPYVGDMGVLGIVPLVLFFGTGILSKEDLHNFLWTVVLLAMGGLVLGDAIKCSGLLDVMAQAIAEFIEDHSLSVYQTLCIFTSLILVCTTFVSHTVGAIVILPIAHAVGVRMDAQGGSGHAKELVFAGALACSAAMGLPVSGFPNMTAVGMEDSLGNRFLTTKDFLTIAAPASIFALAVLISVGYLLIVVAVEIDGL